MILKTMLGRSCPACARPTTIRALGQPLRGGISDVGQAIGANPLTRTRPGPI
ncbi:MAG: hypothetical protein H7251_18880 [Acetobacteraceae bacterium]|nr:hypothetical protein [Acetobacteraceae bacterium]